MSKNILCGQCKVVLVKGMEVEYSKWLTEFYCSPSCAEAKYFEYLDSSPVDFENLNLYGLSLVKNKLVSNIKEM